MTEQTQSYLTDAQFIQMQDNANAFNAQLRDEHIAHQNRVERLITSQMENTKPLFNKREALIAQFMAALICSNGLKIDNTDALSVSIKRADLFLSIVEP